ncbi:MAG: hypothetical protein WAV40_00735, partial [Microgenomates group bacterium]
ACIDTYNVSKAGPKDAAGNDMAISKAEKIVKDKAKAENPEFCSGGSGVKLPPGSYVASGGGWEADGKTTCTNASTSCPFRKCIKLDKQCNRSKPERCDKVADKSKLILPAGAGPEYTVGKTQAQIDVSLKTDTPILVPENVNSCLEKGTFINRPNGYLLGTNRCLNGNWVPDLSKSCNTTNQQFDPTSNTCTTVTVIQEKQDSGTQTAAGSTKSTCLANPDNRWVGTSCLTSVDLGRQVKSCEETGGKLFDLTTGKCVDSNPKTTNTAVIASNTALLNQPPCKNGLQPNGNVWVVCGSGTTSTIYKFCYAGKGTFDKDGNCTPPANSSASTPQTNLPTGLNLMIVGDYTKCPDLRYWDRVDKTDTISLYYICQDENLKNLDKNGQPITSSDTPTPNTPTNIESDQPVVPVVAKGTQVGGTTLNAGDCKYAPKPPDARSHKYNCPAEPELTSSKGYVPSAKFFVIDEKTNDGKVCNYNKLSVLAFFSTHDCSTQCFNAQYRYDSNSGKYYCGTRDIANEIKLCAEVEIYGLATWDQGKLKCVINVIK